MLTGEGFSLLSLYFASSFEITKRERENIQLSSEGRIPLVSDEHNDHVAVAVLASIFQPRGQMVESVSSIKGGIILLFFCYY